MNVIAHLNSLSNLVWMGVSLDISVIIPMYNEEENVVNTMGKVVDELKDFPSWELIIVDDGSTDGTYELAKSIASANDHILVLSHSANYGRGRALRTGFSFAQGDIWVTLDADLSYSADHISKLVRELESDQSLDIVVGSPYSKGGKVVGVPYNRLILSKIGNRLLGFALPGRLRTITGILRAYRKRVFDELELESEDKEIHLEILAKSLALGHHIREIPAMLRARENGKSKLHLRATILSHLMFSFYEKPAMLFGAMGAIMVISGFICASFLFTTWLQGRLNPDRPLMAVTVTLIVAGIQVFFFGFVATQIVSLKRELYRIQKNNLKAKNSNDTRLRDHDLNFSVITAGRRKLE